MPPSWPSRLRSGSNNNSPAPNNAAPSPSQRTDKPLPNPPALVSPYSQNRTPSSPTRSSSVRQHVHNRSASHPLPRLFSKKKSLGNLNGTTGADAPVDDSLVPVLDEGQMTNSPTRMTSGKRKPEDDPNDTRHCMCCHSKVRFPRGLRIFRCTSCLTINDLEPFKPRGREDEGRASGQQLGIQPAYLLGPKREECLCYHVGSADLN